jgi:rhamnogalacturonan acetylesterase
MSPILHSALNRRISWKNRGHSSLSPIFLAALAGMLYGMSAGAFQATPGKAAPQPRGASGAASSYAREHIPFTNESLTGIDPRLPTLFIAGDSTAARNSTDIQRGWGAVLVDYFDSSKINLVNCAQGGASFPSYYAGRWPQVVAALKPGDFVIVEFGHNGGHLNGTGEETRIGIGGREVQTFGWYIRKFAADARSKGATPIISTPTVRNIWTNPNAKFMDSTIVSRNEKYNSADDKVERSMGQPLDNGMISWAKLICELEKIAFVDHCQITAELYEKMGREAVEKLFIQDHTHTTTEGAVINAETFITGLKALKDMPLVNCLNDKGKTRSEKKWDQP